MSKFIDKDGLEYLLVRINEMIEQAKQIDIITTIDDNSTNQQIPGAKAVYDLLTEAIAGTTHISMEEVTTLPTTGESNIIYLVAVSGQSNTYSQHYYTGGHWINLGTTEIDLSDYWAKDDLEAMTNTEIQAVIDDVMGV